MRLAAAMTALESLARAAGIAVNWTDAGGKRRRVGARSLRAVLAALGYPAETPAEIRRSRGRLKRQLRGPPLRVVEVDQLFPAVGRRLRLIGEDGARHLLPVSRGKARADLPIGYYRLAGRRRLAIVPATAFQPAEKLWGISVQLYALRGSPGIGDFGALGRLCEDAARAGADAVLVSPVPPLRPGTISPYSPASRLFLNPLYIPASGGDPKGDLIDWARAEKERLAALRRAFARQERGPPDPDFARFRKAGGEQLARHARFGGAADSRFQLYLQWRADRALARAQARARAAGMTVGLIVDMPVGIDPSGSEAAANAGAMLQGLSIGAPPDALGPEGQNWGLTTYSPAGLIRTGYAGFIQTLRAAMRHAGGIRLDHAMSLTRLWVIPRGMAPGEGAYLTYPMEALLGLLCLESRRHRALVIAEDLGTVPAAFRRRMVRAGLLGMEVLWFARGAKGSFIPPRRWPAWRAALSTTHDLPTLAGWWRGRDLEWRERISGRADVAARRQRARDRRALWKALCEGEPAKPMPRDTGPFADQVIAGLAKAPSPVTLIAIEDMVGETEQPNIPGTTDEHPNWRRRLSSAQPLASRAARRRAALLNGGPG
jgi:4-alpha-glucanotransferase